MERPLFHYSISTNWEEVEKHIKIKETYYYCTPQNKSLYIQVGLSVVKERKNRVQKDQRGEAFVLEKNSQRIQIRQLEYQLLTKAIGCVGFIKFNSSF